MQDSGKYEGVNSEFLFDEQVFLGVYDELDETDLQTNELVIPGVFPGFKTKG